MINFINKQKIDYSKTSEKMGLLNSVQQQLEKLMVGRQDTRNRIIVDGQKNRSLKHIGNKIIDKEITEEDIEFDDIEVEEPLKKKRKIDNNNNNNNIDEDEPYEKKNDKKKNYLLNTLNMKNYYKKGELENEIQKVVQILKKEIMSDEDFEDLFSLRFYINMIVTTIFFNLEKKSNSSSKYNMLSILNDLKNSSEYYSVDVYVSNKIKNCNFCGNAITRTNNNGFTFQYTLKDTNEVKTIILCYSCDNFVPAFLSIMNFFEDYYKNVYNSKHLDRVNFQDLILIYFENIINYYDKFFHDFINLSLKKTIKLCETDYFFINEKSKYTCGLNKFISIK